MQLTQEKAEQLFKEGYSKWINQYLTSKHDIKYTPETIRKEEEGFIYGEHTRYETLYFSADHMIATFLLDQEEGGNAYTTVHYFQTDENFSIYSMVQEFEGTAICYKEGQLNTEANAMDYVKQLLPAKDVTMTYNKESNKIRIQWTRPKQGADRPSRQFTALINGYQFSIMDTKSGKTSYGAIEDISNTIFSFLTNIGE